MALVDKRIRMRLFLGTPTPSPYYTYNNGEVTVSAKSARDTSLDVLDEEVRITEEYIAIIKNFEAPSEVLGSLYPIVSQIEVDDVAGTATYNYTVSDYVIEMVYTFSSGNLHVEAISENDLTWAHFIEMISAQKNFLRVARTYQV